MIKQFHTLVCGSALLLSGTPLLAQKICQQAAVYFESGKSTLSAPATRRLDSLIATWGNHEVHLELEGHTDSINATTVNQTLSEDRIATVKSYVERHSKARLTIKTFAVGEQDPAADNGSELGMAQNRRVELQYIMLKNGNFTFSGEQGSTMTMPASALTGCSLCNTDFFINYFGTDESIAAAGIGMATVDGGHLTSAGMVTPKIGCGGREPKGNNFPARLTFPVANLTAGYSAWVTNKSGQWEKLDKFSIENGIATLFIPEYYWGCGGNWDKEEFDSCSVVDTSGLQLLRYRLEGRKSTIPVKLELDKFYVENELNGTFSSLAMDNQSRLWICEMDCNQIPISERITNWFSSKFKRVVSLDHYRPIHFSDTTQILKVKRRLKVAAVHYVIPEADTTFAFQQISKRKFESPVLNYPHKLAFETIGARRFGVNPDAITKRYRTRKQRWQGKVKKF